MSLADLVQQQPKAVTGWPAPKPEQMHETCPHGHGCGFIRYQYPGVSGSVIVGLGECPQGRECQCRREAKGEQNGTAWRLARELYEKKRELGCKRTLDSVHWHQRRVPIGCPPSQRGQLYGDRDSKQRGRHLRSFYLSRDPTPSQ